MALALPVRVEGVRPGLLESAAGQALPDSRSPGLTPSPEDSNPDLPTEPDAVPAPSAAAPSGDAGLPPLEELVARIPAEVRAALDDLFRARFTGVTRASPKEVTSPPAK